MKNIIHNNKILLISSISATMTACHATKQNVGRQNVREISYDIMREIRDFTPNNAALPQFLQLNRIAAKCATKKVDEIYEKHKANFFPEGQLRTSPKDYNYRYLSVDQYYYDELSHRLRVKNTQQGDVDNAIAIQVLLEEAQSPLNVKNPMVLHKVIHHLGLCSIDKEAIVELLLNQGVNPNSRGSYQRTPLHLAANQSGIIKLLLSNPSIDPNTQDEFGNTPLHMAVHEYPSSILAFNRAGVNPNVQNNNGNTPLHLAVELGLPFSIRSLRKLTSASIDLTITNSRGETALEMATRLAQEETNPCLKGPLQDCINALRYPLQDLHKAGPGFLSINCAL